MASKKLKRAATIAAGIGAAYLASQALGKKKPTSAEAKGLKITRAKKFDESDEGQMARLNASVQKGLDIARSKPFEASDEAAPGTYENVPGIKFLSTPGGLGPVTLQQSMEQQDAFGPMAKDGKFFVKGDRLTKADVKNAEARSDELELDAAQQRGLDITRSKPSELNQMEEYKKGGSVVARGNKLARSKPTKLF